MTKTELRRAAKHLRLHARILRTSYTSPHDGKWTDDPDRPWLVAEMKAEHDDKLDLARKLDGLARITPGKGMG